MFIISLTYTKEISEIESFIESHNGFLDKYYTEGKFIVSGRKNPRTGGIILANNTNLEELQIIIQEDPFHQNQLADYEIIEFVPTKSSPEIAKILNL